MFSFPAFGESVNSSGVRNLAVTLGKRITKERERCGLTLPALAVKVRISKGYLYDIENGKKIPTLPMLVRIAKALKRNARDFL
jgi:transcriptional regulator with XRE-family HTH domain